jgi:tetratricopeptide (TPR) repeat protein
LTRAARATILSAMQGARRAIAVGLAVCAAAASALADPDPDAKARAAKLFDEGRAATSKGDYARACDRFEKSYALDPAPGTEMNLGDCAEHQGQLRKAWKIFDASARDLQRRNDARAAFAQERADKLRPQLAAIIVRFAPPLPAGLALTIAKHEEPATAEVRDVIEPGAIEIVATAPDKAPITRTVTAEAGKTIKLDLAFVGDDAAAASSPVAAASAPPPAREHEHEPDTTAPARPADDEAPRRASWVHAALGIGGAGAAVEITGLLFGYAARGDHQDALASGCTQMGGVISCTAPGAAKETQAGHLADIGTALTIGGGALLVAGAIVYFAAPRDAEAVHVAPIAGDRTVGLALAGAF